uniref:PHD-type domain-containing protein n=2 Tax=Panagrolaimus sp. JU765 TaxID=591449 RepID=A0AC34QTP0_9BILA
NSEDDEDFALAEESGDDDGGSGSDSAEDSEAEDGSEEEEDETSNDASVVEVDGKTEKKPVELCCICLNPGKPDVSICKCDRCQLMVHESCYGIIDEETETVSSGNDVPWFCEPCMYGLVEPPYCQMCPNRFGAFKKTDIGGNWVHLTCAHYIDKMTFADADSAQGVSYQEIDHKQFGRKPCHGCTDKLEARVGIAVQCESGLCRNFYHPTCAQ